jgi:hypothetical protein
VRGQRHQPAPEPAPGAGNQAPGPADDAGAEHGRRGQKRGISIDAERLSQELGMPVVETVAVQAGGEKSLLRALDAMWPLPASQPNPLSAIDAVSGRDAARSAPHPRLVVSPPSTDDT